MPKKLKTCLFWVFVFAALLGAPIIGGLNGIVDSQFAHERPASTPPTSTDIQKTVCSPSLDQTDYEQLNTLTLIGTAFAILGATISVVETKPNPLLGKIVLIMTLLIYSLSTVGHYAQVNALTRGTYESQQKVWEGINNLMIVAWFIFGCVGTIRWLRVKFAQHRVQLAGGNLRDL